MLEFKIQIAGGSLVEINEPIGFDKVDFNLTRSETLHSISSNFAGNSIEFEFNKDVHYNVFDAIIQEYEVNGFLGNVMLFISYNGSDLFKGSFDFSTTQTDMLNYLKCQIVNKDKLYLLDKNKGVAVDLLSDKDLEQNTVTPAPISTLSLPPVELFRESIWEDTEVRDYYLNGGFRAFNNAQNTTKYEINDSITWMSFSEPFPGNDLRPFQLVSAKENLKNINVTIEYENGTYFQQNGAGALSIVRLWIYYGEERPDLNNGDWATQVNKVNLHSIVVNNYPQTFQLPNLFTYSIPSLPRGSGIWIAWEVDGAIILHNTGSKITINGTSTNFYSLTNSIKYTELVKNAVKKASNINNVVFNVNYYNNTYAFNGNLLRNITDKGFDIKWQDIAKQLNERNLGAYYNETTDTLIIDHRNNILGSNLIGSYGDLAKKDFYFVTEDENFIVNKFNYKYGKFQAQKENNVNGNNASVHGESEWYINNKTFEGSIDVDLPFVRDSFMIEDIRQKALEYKEDTATNEDSTVVLVEVIENEPNLQVEEKITVLASFENGNQILMNDGSFSWLRIGVWYPSIVYINGWQYFFSGEITNNRLQLTAVNILAPELNGKLTIDFSYTLTSEFLGKLDNGLMNQEFSVRQNIDFWKQTLNVANYYNQSPITNTIYKENKEAVINGINETNPIDYINPMHAPRIIDSKVMISVDDYFYLKNNKIGYISIYNQNNELINIYLTELKALFLNGCNQMEATLKGWVKNDYTPPILTTHIVTKYFVDGYLYNNLNFVFDDLSQRIYIYDSLKLIYGNLTGTQICSNELCMIDYNSAKNYLLSL